MARQYKLARKMKKNTLTAAAKDLGVAQPTLSAWESGRKNPSVESLEQMADYYGVTTDFLLGRTTTWMPDKSSLTPVSPKTLPSLHGQPAWTPKYDWVLIDAVQGSLITTEHGAIPFADAVDVYMTPPAFSVGYRNLGEPLTLSELKYKKKTWLEPISPDSNARSELRGWYVTNEYYVQNEHGTRFYMDTYGVKWLAFDSELE